jgi:phage gpG-like protein
MYVEEFAQYCDEVTRDFESKPLPGLMRECHAIFLEGERDIFANQVAPDGEAWAARKDSAGHPLLNLSGALMAAATGGPGHVVRLEGRSMEAGVQKASEGSLAGAGVHQYGATIVPKRKKFLSFVVDGVRRFAKKVFIPARPYVGANYETQTRMADVVTEGFREEVFDR